MLPQVVHIESNQSFGYKTQHGETYGRNTKCVVHFKVLLLLKLIAPKIHHCVHFVHRRAAPVPLWWCLAQSLTSPTQRQTARAKGEISLHSERKGWKQEKELEAIFLIELNHTQIYEIRCMHSNDVLTVFCYICPICDENIMQSN